MEVCENRTESRVVRCAGRCCTSHDVARHSVEALGGAPCREGIRRREKTYAVCGGCSPIAEGAEGLMQDYACRGPFKDIREPLMKAVVVSRGWRGMLGVSQLADKLSLDPAKTSTSWHSESMHAIVKLSEFVANVRSKSSTGDSDPRCSRS